MNSNQATPARIAAFKYAMLNTCLMAAKRMEQHRDLSLMTCMKDRVFCMGAYKYLGGTPFSPPIEQAMSIAVGELRNELWQILNTKQDV